MLTQIGKYKGSLRDIWYMFRTDYYMKLITEKYSIDEILHKYAVLNNVEVINACDIVVKSKYKLPNRDFAVISTDDEYPFIEFINKDNLLKDFIRDIIGFRRAYHVKESFNLICKKLDLELPFLSPYTPKSIELEKIILGGNC